MKVKTTLNQKENTNKGITLIALVITIIVLLILAAVSIATLTGENGLFNKAEDAGKETKEKSAVEKVQLMLADYMTEKYIGTKTLEEYLNEQKENGELDQVTNNGDGTITVEVDGYEITIKQDDLSIMKIEKGGGVRPTFEIKITKTDGRVLTGDETEKAITINITNIAEFGENYTIEVKDEEGNTISKETNVITGIIGQASYIINKSGSYTITVTATKDGITKTATKTEEIHTVVTINTILLENLNNDYELSKMFSESETIQKIANDETCMNLVCENEKLRKLLYDNYSVTESALANSTIAINAIKNSSNYKTLTKSSFTRTNDSTGVPDLVLDHQVFLLTVKASGHASGLTLGMFTNGRSNYAVAGSSGTYDSTVTVNKFMSKIKGGKHQCSSNPTAVYSYFEI